MAITTQALLIAAMEGGQRVRFSKTAAFGNGSGWASCFNIAGDPAAGTLAGTSTTAGVVPTDATVGCPTINDWASGTGYLGGVEVQTSNTNTLRMRLHDMLFKAGAYSFNSNVALAAQPSYSSRVPGADYSGTEIWIETTANFTGTPTFTITYTNQAGTTGKVATLTPTGSAAFNLGLKVPLAAGDTGVQKIENVQCAVATVGTFNVLVLRPLWTGAPIHPETTIIHGPDKTDLPIVFDDSALYWLAGPGAGASPFDALLTIING